jgi:gluconolactonase
MSGAEPAVRLSDVNTLVGDLDHPECVAWDPAGRVLYAGGEAGQIYVIGGGAARQVAQVGGIVLGLAVDADGYVYACAGSRVVRADPRTGAVDVYSSGAPDKPMRTPNYLAFGVDGSLYVTDSGEWDGRSGVIYRISPDHQTSVWTSDVPAFTNGCCISPDGDALVVVQSQDPGVWRVPTTADGTSGRPEVICRLPQTVPDGVAYDADGALYISCYRPDRIYRFASGELEILADDPSGITLCSPTNIAFFGDGFSLLAAANLGSRHVSVIELGVSGRELVRPHVDWHPRGSEVDGHD